MKNSRAIAALIIHDVFINGRSLTEAFSQKLNQVDPTEHALIKAICYGVCRWFFRLEGIAKQLLDKPLKHNDQDIYCLILVGIYQLYEMDVAEYAVINETVNAAKALKKDWAKNLVNAILRSCQREKENLDCQSNEELFSHPNWMIGKIKKSWPNEWEVILKANNQQPPFSLRVNLQKISRENYLKQLTDTQLIPETQSGFILEKPVSVESLPGFAEGLISVQDGAAQLAAELLDVKPNMRVLDACAAPGGKAAHLFEIEPSINLFAVDRDEKRLSRVRENFSRLNVKGEIICADAADIESWWDGKPFDRILLDAPCTALGVIRRHPDIKLLRRYDDIQNLNKEQSRLLNELWRVLAPGGVLLYATCSIIPEENFLMVKSFLDNHTDAQALKIEATWGMETIVGRQILPGMHNMDGFYYCKLQKEK